MSDINQTDTNDAGESRISDINQTDTNTVEENKMPETNQTETASNGTDNGTDNETDKLRESGAYVVGGATAGALLLAMGGRVALAFGGGSASVGLAPAILVGAATGLAVYGGKEGFGPSIGKLWGKIKEKKDNKDE
jgi:hypothetical protein